MTAPDRFSVFRDGCEGVRRNGTTCSFEVAYPVMTDSGPMRCCAGCVADLRLKGEKVTFIRGRIAA